MNNTWTDFRRNKSTALQQRFWRWVDRRSQPADTHQLNRRNLYIFPSRQGFAFLVIIVLLWLLGTNFENNLILALAFLLTTLFIVTILHTFSNLAGVTIQVRESPSVFKGEVATIPLELATQGERCRENISLRFTSSSASTTIDTVSAQHQIHHCYVPAQQRGWLNTGKLIVETTFPLGLMRCWTRLKITSHCLIYPEQVFAGPFPVTEGGEEDGTAGNKVGTDEFSGFREYRAGDSLKHFAWKHYARGAGDMVKEFSAYNDSRLWFRLQDTSANNLESQLSQLCDWVMRADQMLLTYGLELPGQIIEPGNGDFHRRRCLETLALFGLPAGAAVE